MVINQIIGDMCNVYLIKSNKTILVDAGASLENIIHYTNKVDYIFITHAHFDHINYINDYAKHFGNAKFLMSEQAHEKLSNNNLNGANMFGVDLNVCLPKDRVSFIKEDDSILDLENENHFVELYGHTDCSCGLIIEDKLFGGDVIFEDGIGRYDLPTGSLTQTMQTQRKLNSMNNIKTIYAGHGNIFNK